MNKLLVDTSIIIDFLRRKEKDEAYLHILAKQERSLAISIITHTELYAGKSIWETSRAQQELSVLLSELEIVSINEGISQVAGRIKAVQGLGLMDSIIASTALYYDMELVTLNTKHFSKVEGLRLFDSKK